MIWSNAKHPSMKKTSVSLRKLILVGISIISQAMGFAQTYPVILGRPTDTSITASLLYDTNTEGYIQYGTSSGTYPFKTSQFTAATGNPLEITLSGLKGNTKYYYTIQYRTQGSTQAYSNSPEYTFQTQRPSGQVFSFVVEADPHLDENSNYDSYRLTLQHMLTQKPDFMVDLGDNFMSDKIPGVNETDVTNRNILFRDYWGTSSHSIPLFITIGNHEGELGWLPNTGPSSLPTYAATIRKTYYPNPFPNHFYSGNSVQSSNVGLREDYYAWEWGDALFVVIDPYFYTKAKPGWGWTLGKDQYDWLKNTLRNSKAKFKFIFSHQLVGGSGTEGRGGTEFAHLYEMGGRNTDSTWGFDINRPGWEKPIHQLMVETKVNVFFHGHDHFYAKQEKDGVVYQEVPQPSAKNITTVTGIAYGYYEGIMLPSRGYILATVSPDSVKLDYIRTYMPTEENSTRKNGEVGFTYTIKNGVVTSIPIISYDDMVKVYPNPANTKIIIETKNYVGSFVFRLLNANGAEMLRSQERELDTSNIPNGAYVIQVKTDKYISSRKIIIKH